MIDIIFTAIVVLGLIFFIVMVCALCFMAGKIDDISEEDWQEFLKKKGLQDDEY